MRPRSKIVITFIFVSFLLSLCVYLNLPPNDVDDINGPSEPHEQHEQHEPHEHKQHEQHEHHKQHEHEHHKQHKQHEQHDCLDGEDDAGRLRFQKLALGQVVVGSAFLDLRLHQPRPHVRIMALVTASFYQKHKKGQSVRNVRGKKTSSRYELACVFSGVANSPIHWYEMTENHDSEYMAFLLSCAVVTPDPCRVTINVTKTRGEVVTHEVVHLRLVATPKLTSKNQSLTDVKENQSLLVPGKYEFATCVPPLFGDVIREQLVEFLEMSRILGNQHVFIYIYLERATDLDDTNLMSVSELLYREVARQYTGYVTAIPWHLPVLEEDVWYFGQVLSIQDCLYRNIYRTDYLIFHDIDEHLIPMSSGPPATWHHAIPPLFSEEGVAGVKVASRILLPAPYTGHPLLANAQYSVGELDYHVGKPVVRPHMCFEVGIHHISRPMNGFTSVEAPTSTLQIFHVKPCSLQMDCSEMVTVTHTLQPYRRLLQARFTKSMAAAYNL